MVRELCAAQSQELQITQLHSPAADEDDNSDYINVVVVTLEPISENQYSLCWESIRLMFEKSITWKRPVKFHCYVLRNKYTFINKQIKRCWEKHKPNLVVILGQCESRNSNELQFEEVASGNTHVISDKQQKLPAKNCCTHNGPPALRTCFDVKDLENKLKTANLGVMGKVSQTFGGYYLCDYAYYNSLYIDTTRTACIRIPDNSGFTPEIISTALSFCITEFLNQLEEKHLQNI